MATLHVRNVPDELYERLRRQAEAEHRSLSAEVISLLERAPLREPVDQKGLLERIRRRREDIERRLGTFPSSVEWLREDRDR